MINVPSYAAHRAPLGRPAGAAASTPMAGDGAASATLTGRATAGVVKQVTVAPFARAIALLSAFRAQDQWLGNLELSQRTLLPASTVSRIVQSLVLLGYLHYRPTVRKYRLAASVLSLGYGAVTSPGVQQVARSYMDAFARDHKVDVCLCARDRLDMVVVETSRGADAAFGIDLRFGVRMGVASSASGWALLASLPQPERSYLLDSVERRAPRDWRRLRNRSFEAIQQVNELGFCAAAAEAVSSVAAPLFVDAQGPLVLACHGISSRMSRTRMERELGPRLLAMTRTIHSQLTKP